MPRGSDRDLVLDAPLEVLARVRAHLPGLQAADARVARVVVERPEVVIHRSAAEVAELASTSAATVVRCAQKLGFKGFHDMKLSLAQELPAFPRDPAAAPAADPRVAALARVTRAGAEAVRDAGALVDPASFEAAVAAISDAAHVVFAGVGTSAPLCQDAAYRFSAVGISAEAPADVHVQHVQARRLAPGDVCVAVSHTGSTHETLQAARGAAQAGATVVAITSFARSALTELADCVIVAGARELGLRLEAVASRLAHLAVLDALLVAVAERDPARSEAALAIYADVLAEHRL
jgi:RpiR family carbohydrate utilization transcriptional regulator